MKSNKLDCFNYSNFKFRKKLLSNLKEPIIAMQDISFVAIYPYIL